MDVINEYKEKKKKFLDDPYIHTLFNEVIKLFDGYKAPAFKWYTDFEFDMENFAAFEGGLELREKFDEDPAKSIMVIEEALSLIGNPTKRDPPTQVWLRIKTTRKEINVKDLDTKKLNKLVVLEGVVKAKSADLLGRRMWSRWRCYECNKTETHGIYQNQLKSYCPRCKKWRKISSERDCSVYYLKLDDTSEQANTTSRSMAIQVLFEQGEAETFNKVRIGARVKITGILKRKKKDEKKQEYRYYVECRDLKLLEDIQKDLAISQADIDKFHQIALSKTLYEDMAQSIAPNIKGYENVKLACLLQLVGGCELQLEGRREERGPIHILLISSPGLGKCFARGTEVLMYDGSIKKVEDVVVDDIIMGDNSIPRKVLSLGHGREDMFKLTPVKGDSFVFNKSHILTLIHSNTKKIIDIPVEEFMDKLSWDPKWKIFRKGVEFNEKELSLPPYFLGVWLGDGSNRTQAVTIPDKEVISYLRTYADSIGYRLSQYYGSIEKKCPCWSIVKQKKTNHPNYVLEQLRKMNLLRNKHIPTKYKVNSRQNRLELLAGLLDADGYYIDNCYSIITKYPKLRDDILYLARSLGLAAYTSEKKGTIKSTGFVGYYHRVRISGEVGDIPCKIERKKPHPRKQCKNALVTGFKLEDAGIDDYYGFELDGNGRFLLADFTVVHNTQLMKRVMEFLPGSRFTGGKSVSGVGLVAAMSKDEEIGGWYVSAGAVPMAHNSLCCIDEGDKIDKNDLAHLNNAMVDMSVNISKAGIHATLQTNTAILLSCNPKDKVFDQMKPIWEQLGLPKDFLDRFDLVMPMLPPKTLEAKKEVAKLIVGKYERNQKAVKPRYKHEFVTKYIDYAKKLKPMVTEEVTNYIVDNYMNIAQPSDKQDQESSAYFSFRLLTNIVRLSQAVAKLRMETVKISVDDTQRAINILISSLKAQQIITTEGLMDYEKAEAIVPKSKRDNMQKLKSIIRDLQDGSSDKLANIDEITDLAIKEKISEDMTDELLEKLHMSGDIIQVRRGKYKLL